jgi:hypothetical protein
MTALSPLAGPKPAEDGAPDPRSAAERQGAGLGDDTLPGAIAAEDARQLACDAQRSHLRLDGRSLPLDIGPREPGCASPHPPRPAPA